jgi:membrane fusion protein, multidrug efflux system
MNSPHPLERIPVPRRRTILVVTCLLIGLFVAHKLLTSHPASKKKRYGEKGDMPIPSVLVDQTTTGEMPVYLNGLGTVTALQTVTVRTRVDGELIRVAYEEGQTVKQGELLAEIDPRQLNVQLQQALGQLTKDEALLINAQTDLGRYQTLLEQDSIAPQLTTTQSSLVKQYQGAMEIDKAQVDNVKLQLSYARITAPISGRIGLRLVDKGNIVKASDPNGIAVITQLQPIAVIFTLPEDVIPQVMTHWQQTPENLIVEAYDRSGHTQLATGKLTAVDNQIDPTTGTLKLKAQFGNDQNSLFSNQFVNIRMLLDTQKNVVLMPKSALQQGANGPFVYTVESDQTIKVKPVKTGPASNTQIVITEGLNPNEKVVIDGADKLREGVEVSAKSSVTGAQVNSSLTDIDRHGPTTPHD